ncbi:MAG: hypothetical protein C5B43_03700 [Verrucomicrobia bacterium]|nr:MAG: hypothetical protein C5B43_03700 [Verrucomicrobiota bacterium]
MKGFLLLLSLSLVMVGCKVGPNYKEPDTLMPDRFNEDRPGRNVAITDEDLVHWWEHEFQDPCLNSYMEATLLYSFDLRIALEKIYQSRANFWIQFTSVLPEVDSDFQATRFRQSQSFASSTPPLQIVPVTPKGKNAPPAPPVPPFAIVPGRISPVHDFFQIGLDVIWQFDLFGKLRRAAVSAYRLWEANIENARGVKITVLTEVATLYVNICYFQEKIDLARLLVKFSEELVAMSRNRFEAGLTNEEEVLTGVAALEENVAALNLLEATLKQNIYSLGILVGRPPEMLLSDFEVKRAIPVASGKIPETLPAELLRRRPDIASAERSLAAQTEMIGVAVADLFPTISLTGSSSSFAANPLQGANIGFSSDKIKNLFKPASKIWGIGTLITWPILDFGKRWANVDVQKFLTNEAYLTYEKTVVGALQEVEVALSNYFTEEERHRHFRIAVGADTRNLDLTLDQFQAGLISYTQVVQVKEQWLTSMNLWTDSQQNLAINFITVYKALGGDW